MIYASFFVGDIYQRLVLWVAVGLSDNPYACPFVYQLSRTVSAHEAVIPFFL